MRTLWLLPLALPLMAAAPPRQQMSLTLPADQGASLNDLPLSLGAPAGKPIYEPAPLPNRDLRSPARRASSEPNLSPTLFSTKTQYRGDGFSPGSTAQADQERRAKPGAGFSLHMPLSPQ